MPDDDLVEDRDDLETAADDEMGGGKMSFLDHLDELRRRIIYALLSVGIGFVIAFFFIDNIFDFVMRPMQQVLGPTVHLQYTSGAEPFMLYVKMGFLVGIFIASPLILWQIWKFIAPGLYTHEKKFAIPFVVMSTIFFTTGGLFAHYIAFPWTWTFFGSFANDYMIFVPKVDEAFSMYSKMLLGFGLIFEMPTLVFVLARMGVITGRVLLKYFKYAVLAISIIAAVISPGTDMMSQVVMAVPMLALYAISILIAFVFQKRRIPATD